MADPVPTPKLTVEQTVVYPAQRSGWQYAQASLPLLLTADGVLFDTMIERNSARLRDTAAASEIYRSL